MCYLCALSQGADFVASADANSLYHGTFQPVSTSYGTSTTASATGIQNIDSLIGGWRWGSGALTFNFPTQATYYEDSTKTDYELYGSLEYSNNFAAVNSTIANASRSILQNQFAKVANLTFTEVGTSSNAAISIAMSDAPLTAWAYYPSSLQPGGDVWLGRANGWYDSPVRGNYAWHTLIHEFGHSMGLKQDRKSVV